MIKTMRYLILFLVLILSSCVPLYFPPVPAKLDLEKTTSLSNSQGLSFSEARLRLSLRLTSIRKEDWLAVQWFAPNNKELSSEAIWINPELEGETVEFILSEDIELTDGLWRAVVSFDNQLLRQFVVELKLAPK